MKYLRFATLLVLGLAVFVAACGNDDDANGANGGNGEPGDDANGESSEVLRLGFSAWPGWFPWQVTEEAGIFEQVGLNVDLVWFDGYLDSINAFAAGQLDANSQTLNDTIGSVAAGSDQVIVLVNDNSTGNDQIIVTEDIQSVADLEGASIGLEAGVVSHYLLLLGLREEGLGPDDVNVQNLETGAAAAAFTAGQLDGVAVFAPFTTQALNRDGSHVLFSSAEFPGAIPDHLVVSRAMVDDRPGDVQRLIEAWFLTLQYINDNPDEAVAIMAERAEVSEEEYRGYDAGTTLFTIDDNLEAFTEGDDLSSLYFAAEDIAAFLLDSGLIDSEVDLDRLFDSSFVEAHAAQ